MNIYTIDQRKIFEARNRLTTHPLLRLNNLQTIDDLHRFMETHVYCVWDFMSLLKTLQSEVCPSSKVWHPNRTFSPNVARLVNEIVLCEETDITPVDGEYMSHFDLYLSAMKEIGANISDAMSFVKGFADYYASESVGLLLDGETTPFSYDDWCHYMDEWAPEDTMPPDHVLNFLNTTFKFVFSGKPHVIAAAFCYGREDVIPDMFRFLLKQLEINNQKAPYFHFYLDRHIQVDTNEHGPAAHKLIEVLCGNDPIKVQEAEDAAIAAIEARIALWDAVAELIK